MSGLLVAGKIQQILDRWTATKAGYLDAAITSRASAANLTTLTNNVATVDANVDAIKAVTDVVWKTPLTIVGPAKAEIALNGLFDTWSDSASASAGAVQNQWYTVDSYSGSGVIQLLSVVAGEALTADYQARLVLDGTTVWTSNSNAWASGAAANDGMLVVGATAGTSAVGVGHVPFSSSFSVDVRCTSAGSSKSFNVYRWYYTTG